jgi:hypothetical protein
MTAVSWSTSSCSCPPVHEPGSTGCRGAGAVTQVAHRGTPPALRRLHAGRPAVALVQPSPGGSRPVAVCAGVIRRQGAVDRHRPLPVRPGYDLRHFFVSGIVPGVVTAIITGYWLLGGLWSRGPDADRTGDRQAHVHAAGGAHLRHLRHAGQDGRRIRDEPTRAELDPSCLPRHLPPSPGSRSPRPARAGSGAPSTMGGIAYWP